MCLGKCVIIVILNLNVRIYFIRNTLSVQVLTFNDFRKQRWIEPPGIWKFPGGLLFENNHLNISLF